jgi:hypothetical protein
MKKQSLRSRSRSGSGSTPPIPVRHQFDHEVPTVIHNPEEKMTALARLTRHIILEPGRYATWGLGILVALFAIVVASNWSSSGRTKTSEVWTKLYSETKPDALAETARRYPGTEASQWAILHAANEYYALAMADLPNNRDVAISNVKRALELYNQIVKEARKESFQARAALLGKARCLEARNELAAAIEQYELVAKNWPGSPEALGATQLAEALKKPEAAAFYKDLFAYSPPKMTLPSPPNMDLAPGATKKLSVPGSARGTQPPSAGGASGVPGTPVEALPDINEIKPAPGTGTLPIDVFTPEKKAETKTPPVAPR